MFQKGMPSCVVSACTAIIGRRRRELLQIALAYVAVIVGLRSFSRCTHALAGSPRTARTSNLRDIPISIRPLPLLLPVNLFTRSD